MELFIESVILGEEKVCYRREKNLIAFLRILIDNKILIV
jgi:hypothetical protein